MLKTSKKGYHLLVGLAAVMLLVSAASHGTANQPVNNGRGSGPIVYVSGQDLYYDSIITADPVPPRGPFQLLVMGPNGLTTQYGPGDRGYLGGRRSGS